VLAEKDALKQELRRVPVRRPNRTGSTKNQPLKARSSLFHLPLLDELRTYCYEHRIEEIPAILIA
jgi:hypothetical protein